MIYAIIYTINDYCDHAVCARGVVRERDNLRIYSSVKCRQLDDAEYHISDETLYAAAAVVVHIYNVPHTQLHALTRPPVRYNMYYNIRPSAYYNAHKRAVRTRKILYRNVYIHKKGLLAPACYEILRRPNTLRQWVIIASA
uniref:Uncharacterized protein n=1 Tax=Schizaphis graminum TaxID=13262 RepID=A0A2S2PGD9_SCHGA